MLGAALQPEIDELIQGRRWDELRDVVHTLHPADLADIIVVLPPEQQAIFFRVIPRPIAAQVFSHLPLEPQEQLLESLSSEQTNAILEHMHPDDRALLMRELPAEVTRRLLGTLSQREVRVTREILGYPPDAAGRYMTPRFVSLSPDMTAEEGLQRVRQADPGSETLNVLFVVGADGKLIADLLLSSLVMADPTTYVRDIPVRPRITVLASADREDVVQTFRKYDRFVLPVTDEDGDMLGIITADDVLDVAAAEATEDMHRIGGMEAIDTPYLATGLSQMIRKRAGWLSVLFVGELLTASAMGYFEHEIAQAVVLAMFIPLIISSGGNSGSQAATLIIRALALQEIRLGHWMPVLGRELASGVTLGGWLGLIGFFRVVLWQQLGFFDYGEHYLLLALTVWLSLIGVVTFGTLTGCMLPFLLRRLGFDPATSSAPFVATLVDVTGLVVYFLVAATILRGALL